MTQMRSEFDRQLEDLKRTAIEMGAFVVGMLSDALRGLVERDAALANEVRKRDDAADNMDEAIEIAATRLLALQQPMAGDLRAITATLKLVTDLERTGDYAVAIARTTIVLVDEPSAEYVDAVAAMGRMAERIVRDSLRAYEAADADMAYAVRKTDKAIDDEWHRIEAELIGWITAHPVYAKQGAHLILIARYLERIGDHAKNICERVAYMATGSRKPWRKRVPQDGALGESAAGSEDG
jgi:phosphate transport system protein